MYFASRFYLLLWSVCLFVVFFVHLLMFYLFFFFQAEDGIRDHCVTGVQTCALPISGARRRAAWTGRVPQKAQAPLSRARPVQAARRRAPAALLERIRPPGRLTGRRKIGRASCRERVEISVRGGTKNNKKKDKA